MANSRFDEIAGRLKLALGVKSDAALGNALGLQPTAYNNRKVAGSIPHEAITELCLREGISLDTVFGLDGGKRTVGEVLSKDEKELLEAYRKLGKEDQKALKRHASAIVKLL